MRLPIPPLNLTNPAHNIVEANHDYAPPDAVTLFYIAVDPAELWAGQRRK